MSGFRDTGVREVPLRWSRVAAPLNFFLKAEVLVPETVCPLLWGSYQLDLEGGRVKACCKTPFEDLPDDAPFLDFLNMPRARAARAEMLQGRLPTACVACQQEEDMGLESYRTWFGERGPLADRAVPLAAEGATDNGFPAHVELIFSTTCNLRCVYCGPEFSSAWRAAAGGRDGVDRTSARGRKARFWNWFEANQERCRSIQINGGEPLVDPEFGDTLTRLAAAMAGRPGRRLALVTNLSMPDNVLDRSLPALAAAAAFVPLVIGVSIDGVGALAESLRPGLAWPRFDANLRRLAASVPAATIELTPTLGARNIASIDLLCGYAGDVAAAADRRLGLRPGVVVDPPHLSIFALPATDAPTLDATADRIGRLDHERVMGLPAMAGQLRRLARAMRQKASI